MKLLRMNLWIAMFAAVALTAGDRWLRAADPAPVAPKPAAKVVYTCPMHPSVQSDKPGNCPICKMALKAKKVAAAPAKADAPMPADALAVASMPASDHADMKMDAPGTDRSGMDTSGESKGMGGMGACPMGACPMATGNMPSSTGKAASAPAIPASSRGGGCGCR